MEYTATRNVAAYGRAFQSSYSAWSLSNNEANNALTDKFTENYAFHTNNDAKAWWAVDLQRTFPIREIRIHLRPRYEARNRKLKIYTSTDMQDWICHGEAEATDNASIIFKKLDSVEARFVKLAVENQYLHLAQVEILANENLIPFRRIKLLEDRIIISSSLLNAIRLGLYERREIDLALNNINNDDIILELGASIGAMSTVLLKNSPPRKYYALEANPELIDLIRMNHQINSLEGKCEIINAAIGDEDREADFYVARDCWASSLEEIPHFLRKEKIRMMNFDNLLKSTQANFLIIDVEGAEHIIFKPETDLSHVNKIVIEIHGKKLEQMTGLYEYFMQKGFSCDQPAPEKREQNVLFFYKKR